MSYTFQNLVEYSNNDRDYEWVGRDRATLNLRVLSRARGGPSSR